jgi:hypothetical protein
VESVSGPAMQMTMECRLKDAGKVSLEMAPPQDAAKGELPGFVVRIDGDGASRDGDTIVIRLPLDADTVWDPDFATIFAATVKLSDGASAREMRLGIGADGALVVEQPFALSDPMHVTWTARFPQRPQTPYLQLTIVLAATALPTGVTVSGIFAGHCFDPYVFNPRFRGVAAEAGTPSFPEGAQVLADFERHARGTPALSHAGRHRQLGLVVCARAPAWHRALRGLGSRVGR